MVNVPVLSEHTVVAVPMVLHATKILTRLLSFSILVVPMARARVTAKVSPSGSPLRCLSLGRGFLLGRGVEV